MAKNRQNDTEAKGTTPGEETVSQTEEAVEEVTGEAVAEEAEAEAEEAEEVAKSPEELMEEKIKAAETKAAENYDRLLRSTAEFDNYKKRSAREFQESKKYANEAFIKQLLPVIDNLERAVESIGDEGDDSGQGVIEGVKMTLSEIFKVFDKFHLKPLESEGKPFDPNFHQAVIQEETNAVPENTVVKEMQKGYLLHDRLIRPAMVVVSKAAALSAGENEKAEAE
ncbi:nucleotide exchange factor GrpE [Desulfoluna spongiiphila]|uniref:nucleotide exchange factor GrpE n=1 Tax=Desulfoluna spongiiphila TaxID=419481 RepID=UPI00125ABD28|nr:nucleotide exchange factor GrpE [Desulfoluna spongiiphila]VVS93732.1 grpe nucleotide exchange factor [Desulfoluna spongiiphila]